MSLPWRMMSSRIDEMLTVQFCPTRGTTKMGGPCWEVPLQISLHARRFTSVPFPPHSVEFEVVVVSVDSVAFEVVDSDSVVTVVLSV